MLKIKRLCEDAKVPTSPRSGDIGYDLYVHSIKSETDSTIVYDTGLAIELPEGYHALLFPRSSIIKQELFLANSVGVIDNSYRGEIIVTMRKLAKGINVYRPGDKFCQLVLIKEIKMDIKEVSELSSTERGDNGFGSTGR